MENIIGWTASIVLIATLIRQITTQVSGDDRSEGVSTWLFLGQATASGLFVVYSILVDNWVFIVTNSCILLTALLGQWVTRRKRRSHV